MKLSALAGALTIMACICLSPPASARRVKPPHDEDPIIKDRKFYSANALDGAIFSTALIQRPGENTSLGTLRFSMLNLGINLHYDFSPGFGMFSGVGIKNIGFIEKFKSSDITVKRRVYSLGVPLAFKFGKLKEHTFFFIGGGADLALNYRVKTFRNRSDKSKFNEWFSDQTQLIMPHVFAGYSFDPGLTIKLQYYPTNFMNVNYKVVTGPAIPNPFTSYKVNLILLSLGIDIHYNVLPKEIPKRH